MLLKKEQIEGLFQAFFTSGPTRWTKAASSARNKVFMMAASRLNHDGRAGHRRKSRRAGRDAGCASSHRIDGNAV